jgi:hypothetical protein
VDLRSLSAPLILIAGMVVPSMLLSYGISHRLAPGAGEPPIQIAGLVLIKLIVHRSRRSSSIPTPRVWPVMLCSPPP